MDSIHAIHNLRDAIQFFQCFQLRGKGGFFCFVLLADINLPAPVVFAPLAVMTTLEDSAIAGRLLSKESPGGFPCRNPIRNSAIAGRLLSKERNPVSFVNHVDLILMESGSALHADLITAL